jgi:hypothetical protein
MGKLTGTVSAVALMAAIGVWSTSTLVTKAAISEHTATTANSFPTAPAELIREPDSAERKLMNAGKGDRLVSIADCGKREWPFLALDCFAATPKEAPPAAPTVTVERRSEPNTSELVRTPASAKVATPAVAAAPAAAAPSAMAAAPASVPPPAIVAASACKQNLAAATARVERALAHIKGTPANADACAGYRRDFFEMVKAREVTAMCKTGADRARDLGTIDVAVERINGAIAQSCRG